MATKHLTIEINAETHDQIERVLEQLQHGWYQNYSEQGVATEIEQDNNLGDVQVRVSMTTKGSEPWYPKEGNLND